MPLLSLFPNRSWILQQDSSCRPYVTDILRRVDEMLDEGQAPGLKTKTPKAVGGSVAINIPG